MTYEFKPCPFCNKTDLSIKEKVLDYKAGHDCPCSAIKKVWAVCNYCGAEGPKTTIETVYESEAEAAACVAWNKRKGRDLYEKA